MQTYILRRLLQGVLTVCMVGVIVFVMGRMLGNPVNLMLREDATEEDRAHLERALGLDRPYYEQFYLFVRGALQGDLGVSIRYRESAVSLYLDRLPNTLLLIIPSIGLALAMALPLGILSALRRGSIVDKTSTAIAVFGIATPSFWMGIVLMFIFSVKLGVLPSARMGGPSHYVLPSVTLGIFLVAGVMRLLRSSMLEVMGSDFVRVARAKGLHEWTITYRHVLRNALIPVLTFASLYLGLLITGAIVVETVFAWPGVGRLAYEAVIFRDYPLLQTIVIMKTLFVLIVNLLVDVMYAYIDPRIRLA